jgi:hypothetical protein
MPGTVFQGLERQRFDMLPASRIFNQWYGRLFLESIEDCPVEQVEIPDLGN